MDDEIKHAGGGDKMKHAFVSALARMGTSGVLFLSIIVLGGERVVGNTTSPVLVDTSPNTTRRWMTIYTHDVPLSWDWQEGASSATLSIIGLNETVTTNFSGVTSNFLWRAFAAERPTREDVYDLTLTFYTNGTLTVGALASRLAVVAGAFGAVTINTGAENKAWGKVTGNVLIPYDAYWTNSTANAVSGQLVIAKSEGATQTNALAGTSGYFGWKFMQSDWGYGTFGLFLTFPGTDGEWNAMLTRLPSGTMIRLQ